MFSWLGVAFQKASKAIEAHDDVDYFKQRLEKYPNVPLITLDTNQQLKYDERAVRGAKMYYQSGLSDLQYRLSEVINKRNSLPSAGNFFNKLSGASGKIREAERQLDEARRQLEARISEAQEGLNQLEHLPELPKYVFDAKAKKRISQQKSSRSEQLRALRQKVTQVI
jgi:vacuolar-type H+-ATPase subunit I/STV1